MYNRYSFRFNFIIVKECARTHQCHGPRLSLSLLFGHCFLRFLKYFFLKNKPASPSRSNGDKYLVKSEHHNNCWALHAYEQRHNHVCRITVDFYGQIPCNTFCVAAAVIAVFWQSNIIVYMYNSIYVYKAIKQILLSSKINNARGETKTVTLPNQ